MSFPGVIKIIGALQLASFCAVAVYAFAAWRRKPPAPKIPTPHCSERQTVKRLADLQRLSIFPPPSKLRSPLAKAEEELCGQAELLPQIDPDPSSASTLAALEEALRRSHPVAPESKGPRTALTPWSPATHPPVSDPQPISSALRSSAPRNG